MALPIVTMMKPNKKYIQQYKHIVITRDQNVQGGYGVYVNGIKKQPLNYNGTQSYKWANNVNQSGGRTYIGAGYYDNNNGGGFKGKLDEIGLWNRPLIYPEVHQLYNGGLGVSYSNLTNGIKDLLQRYWGLNESTGNIAYDSVGANNLSLSNITRGSGIIGNDLSFNGNLSSNGVINNIPNQNYGTLSLWINTELADNSRIFFNFNGNTSNIEGRNFYIYYHKTNNTISIMYRYETPTFGTDYFELIYSADNSNIVTGDLIYTNTSDSYKIYKKSFNNSNIGTAITNSAKYDLTYSPNGENIVYRNGSGGNLLYIKNANTIGEGVAITTVGAYDPAYSPNGQYIVYQNTSDSSVMYRKSSSGLSNGSAITTDGVVDPVYSPDGQYIVYSNFTNGNKLYRKNANDVSNGTAITSVGGVDPVYSPDGQYIVYVNTNDGNKLYKKNANDINDGIPINSFNSRDPNYSPDGQYIVYTNFDNNRIYKKNSYDNSNGTHIDNMFGLYPAHSPIGDLGIYNENVGRIILSDYPDYNNFVWITQGVVPIYNYNFYIKDLTTGNKINITGGEATSPQGGFFISGLETQLAASDNLRIKIPVSNFINGRQYKAFLIPITLDV